ncbi:MAG: hypothetical protein V4555_15385 [Acidobacteriota bacterium]
MRLRCYAALSVKLLLAAAVLAQNPAKQPHAATHHPSPVAETSPKTAALPVTSVSLYKNGVGFFEHTGHVSGNASVSIDFTSSQLNDVLQSLTAIDLNGGRISGAGYNSTTPLEQQLRTLPIALGEDPTASQYYASIRGARVEVRTPGASIAGRLLSIETRPAPPTDATTPNPERLFLTVVSDSGDSRTLEITAATTVHLLDPSLQQNVNRYLQLLDSTRSQGLRHLTLEDLGSAANRELHVSYISEVPVWKSTYRILFTDSSPGAASKSPGGPFVAPSATSGEPQNPAAPHTATLQGWSVVDNTTGADWINVHLSLIAGAPQSFIQPLSQPLYTRRPEVPIAQEAQLTPQTFESGMEDKERDRFSSPAKVALGVASETVEVNAPPAPVAAPHSFGIMGGVISNQSINSLPMNGRSYQDLASDSITPATTAAAFDDFFQYKLTDPVTILKNQSALVPILQSKIDADRVTLVSYNGGQIRQPLRALWITNTSGLTLDRGSFSIVENGNFGGEGLLDPIHPDEKRLLSYAADQAVHVTTQDDKSTNHITLLRGSKGIINIHRADSHDITFNIHNSAADRRTVVLEVPVVDGYKLTSEAQPTETTASVYRFRVEVAAGETAHLHTTGEHKGYTTYYLTSSDDNQIRFLLDTTDHNPAFEAALQPILEARRNVSDAQTLLNQTNAELARLRDDENRLRDNITALKDADKSSQQRFIGELNHDEDAIATNQTTLADRTKALEAAKAELANRIQSFQINEELPTK